MKRLRSNRRIRLVPNKRAGRIGVEILPVRSKLQAPKIAMTIHTTANSG
jgi:hypothetical protein